MKNQIKCAFIIHSSKEVSQLQKDLESTYCSVEIFSKISDILNNRFYDVVLVHENFLTVFDRKQFLGSQVIILTESQKRVAELYPKLKNLDIFTILEWPISSQKVISFISQAYNELITEKKSHAMSDKKGKSIFITSFSNGAGKTLASYNLASKMTQFFSTGSISLVDMNLPFSTARSMLNIQDTYNWYAIRPILNEGVPQKQKIQNIVYNTKYGFSLLSGPSDYESNTILSEKEFQNLDTSLVQQYKTVIYDTHTLNSKEDFNKLNTIDMVLIIVDMTSQGVLQTSRGLTFLREKRLDLMDKVRFIFNRVDEAKGHTAELVESKLDLEAFAIIDEDREAVNTFIENGELFADKTLLIDNQFYRLAEKIIKELY